MRILTFLTVCIGLLMTPIISLGTDVFTIEEFTKALAPARPEAQAGPETDQATRGLGGTQDGLQQPSADMHLTFNINSAQLSAESKEILNNLGQALETEALRDYVYRLEGHTCDLGQAAYNHELSRKRALAVRDYLVEHGKLGTEQFEVAWFGESQPSVPNLNEEARRRNRRVAIVNTLQDLASAAATSQTAVLQIKSLRDNLEVELADGEVLTGEDHYSVAFRTATDLYIYVYQIDATGQKTMLFPNPEFTEMKNPVPADTYQRLPGQGQWFYLDANTGQEQLVLIGAKGPLEDLETLCTQVTSGWVQITAGWTTTDALGMYASSNIKRGLGGVATVQPQDATNENFALETSRSPGNLPDTGADLYVVQRYFDHQQ